MMKNKKLLYFGIGLLFITILISGFLIFSKGSTKYFMYSDHYTVSCYQGSEKVKNIPCSSDKDCSIENMHAYCSPGYFDQLECPGARYYCGDDGYCKGCVCF